MDDFRIYNRILTPSEISTIATPATSDQLVDTNALVLRYNFDTAGVGTSLSCPVGALQSTPALSSHAWTPVSNAGTSYPFLLPSGSPSPVTTNSALFYRIGF
jgi:hypothetical protein